MIPGPAVYELAIVVCVPMVVVPIGAMRSQVSLVTISIIDIASLRFAWMHSAVVTARWLSLVGVGSTSAVVGVSVVLVWVGSNVLRLMLAFS